eukprot:5377864-Ditylum_brightwellii.AAC.2
MKVKLIAIVLEKAPKEYGSVFTVDQCARDDKLEMSHLQGAMTQLYRTLYCGDADGNSNKVVFVMANLECYNCGEKGHTTFQCPKPKKNRGRNGGGRGIV